VPAAPNSRPDRPEPADFARDSTVERLGEDAWGARVTDSWSAPPGPNGGYVAALILRAIQARVSDPARRPRTLTVHYLRPPAVGEVRIEVTVERSGRSATTCSARLLQDGKERAIALCTLSEDYEGALAWAEPLPDVPAPEQVDPLPPADFSPAIFHQFEFRPAFGELPMSGADSSLTGGWMRTRRPTPLDAELLLLYCDAWWPVAFPRLERLALAPTLELTIHFRDEPPSGAGEQVLARFDGRHASHGFFDEQGELWSADGRLLAQSRQLALLRALPE
jgi:acyl-CoA thioesterase